MVPAICHMLIYQQTSGQNTTPRPNLTHQEARAIKELKSDKTRIILMTDMGVAMVVMDGQDYITKVQGLLDFKDTYWPLPKDHTPIPKSPLINILKNCQGQVNQATYKRLYPTCAIPFKCYGLPKIHKPGSPLRPIVSSRGSITYKVAKGLVSIL